MALPVRALVRPGCLAGQSNGQLSASIMAETPGEAGGAGVLLVEPAARAWRALCAAARADGHVLKIGWPNSAYRPYADQERIFRQRYTTTYLSGRPYKTWNGRRWYQRPGTAVAAVPGTSNHGWGLAVDVGEERDGDSGTESVDAGTVAWLIDHEHLYGWSHEIQSEPWHIRYFAGDRLPAAVVTFDQAETVAPPSEEDDMDTFTIRDEDGTIWLCGPGMFHALNPEQSEAFAWRYPAATEVNNRQRDLWRSVLMSGNADEIAAKVKAALEGLSTIGKDDIKAAFAEVLREGVDGTG